DLVLRVSRSGICLDVVPAAGFTRIDVGAIGKPLTELLPMKLVQQYLTAIEHAFATGTTQCCNSSLWVEGEQRYQEVRIVASSDDEVLMIVRDITEHKQAEETNAMLAAAVEHAVEAIEITDANARIVYVNPAFERLTGFSRAEVVGKPALLFWSEQHDRAFYQEIWDTVSIGNLWQGDLVGQRRDGSLYQQEVVISPVQNSAGAVIHYIAVKRDVTERKQTEAALKRYQLLSQHARDIVLFMRPDGQIVEANNAAVEAYGYSHAELLTLSVHRLHDGSSATSIEEQLRLPNGQGALFEAVHCRKDSSRFPVEVSVQAAAIGQETLLLSIVRDITNRKRAETTLFHNAFHDALTNLPNRSLFMDRLRRAVQQSTENEYKFAVLFLDLDGFKVINDGLGHLAGDQLLVAIAQRLSSCLSPNDTLARFGSDEFTILLEDVQDLSYVTQTAQRIQQELTLPFKLRGQNIFTTTSIGIALSTPEIEQPEDLLRSADTALYRAKALGGTRYVVFDEEMHNRALMRLHLETDLRHALADPSQSSSGVLTLPEPEHPEFHVHYQPIVCLKTLEIQGFEALVRWQHPERGLISPGSFIPVAEETGLIVPIGLIVLRAACRQMQRWQQIPTKRPLTISVNLSVKQLTQPDLVEQICHALEETQLSPAHLKLEITESALMDNPEVAARMLGELQALGVQLSLDDFGTGYSSLAYLHRFPINTLKIDRSFISRVDTDGEQLEIVRAIVTLAWNLGIEVVAEGIETNTQLAQLRALRCEYGQGYFFSKPVASEMATALIVKDKE
ncbi:EAL domain-containing protein, partial [Leptolyngbya sp. FACHB-36]|uniref:sensor domain-containing protein n=1 Tax=Leptolyngbya sp. FACHB-36 TaxID=2692808 RepID=UPI001681AB43